jgi:hypothetical protein
MLSEPVVCIARDRAGRIVETKSFPSAAAAQRWTSDILGDPRILQVEFVLPIPTAPSLAPAAA